MKNREFLDHMIDYLFDRSEVDLEANYIMWKDDIVDRISHDEPLFDKSVIREISEGVIFG